MFKIATEPTFTRDVTICVPVDGGHLDQTLKVTFRALPDLKLSTTGGSDGQIEDCQRVIVRLDDLVDENDKPVSYSEGLRDQLIGMSYVRVAILKAYIDAMSKVKSGN